MTAPTRTVETQTNYETVAWKWMRYSGIALIPLAWIHVLIQDVVVGVHAIDIDYVIQRWSSIGWQVFDILLLAFAFAHGMNGLRQVANEHIQSEKAQKTAAWIIFVLWLVVSAIGAIAIVASSQARLANL